MKVKKRDINVYHLKLEHEDDLYHLNLLLDEGDMIRALTERREATQTDRITAVTKDGSLSAHFEHTVAITSDGPLVLSQPFKFEVLKSSSAAENMNRLVSVDGV